jgi:hypothetical protein
MDSNGLDNFSFQGGFRRELGFFFVEGNIVFKLFNLFKLDFFLFFCEYIFFSFNFINNFVSFILQ